jgi:hypothetical protein
VAANPAFPWPPPEEEPRHLCPHGVEATAPEGACDLCAAEDAGEGPGYFIESWDEWPW